MSDIFTSVADSLATEKESSRYVQKRIPEITAVDAYAGFRVADRLLALILEVDQEALAGADEWPKARGFEVFPEALSAGEKGARVRLCLQLLDVRYENVFRSLCGDICQILADAPDPRHAVRQLQRRLLRWRSFLENHGPDGLGEQARCGLFGELIVLRDLLLPHLAARHLVQAWRGCKKAPQDFQFPARALEVKATRAVIPDRITISNVRQLDDEGMGWMGVTVVHVNENETVGEALPDLVEDLRSKLPDDAVELLNEGLEEVGYLDAHRNLYLKTLYQTLEFQHLEVREGFPRLLRNQVPEGVKAVRYELSLDACKAFRIEEAVLLRALTGQEG